MANQKVLVRIMGESDIIDVTMAEVRGSSSLLIGLDDADRINLLGHWMDQGRGAALANDKTYLDAMTQIASSMVANSLFAAKLDAGANFILLTILREKWVVGSKAKFKIIAGRVKADHTYIAHICDAAELDSLIDQETLKREETNQLSTALSFYKANKRRFANSSAVQGLIKA